MKAYLSLLRFILMILAFILGMISSIVLLVGGVYFVASGVSLGGLEKFGIVIDTSEVLDDDANTPVRDLTVIDMLGEAYKLYGMFDTATLDYLSEEYGLILPAEGSSSLFDVMRDLPFSKLFSKEGINGILSNIRVGELLGYEMRIDDSDPINPVECWYNTQTGEKVTGIETMIVGYTLHTLINGGFNVSEITNSQPIGVFLGYENVDGEWVRGDGTDKLTGVMNFIAGKKLDEVGSTLNDAKLGEILGYEKGDDGVWTKDGVPMTGALKAFADNTLGNIEAGVNEMQIGTILGYDWDEEKQEWYTTDEHGDRHTMSGPLKAFASDSLTTLESGLGEKQIGVILGYDWDEENQEWYTMEGDIKKPMTGALKAFAGSKINDMEDSINTAKIGSILGYDWDEENQEWYIMEDGVRKPMTGTMKAFASETLQTLETGIDDKEIGLILGYEKEPGPDGKWFKYKEDGVTKDYMTGALTAFADNKLSNMEDGVNTALIGTILGYEKESGPDGKWFKYKEGSNTEKEYLSGTMLAFADESLSTLENNIENKQIGIILGYEKEPGPDGKWFKYKEDGVTKDYMTGALKAFADNNLGNMEDGINSAKIGTILGYEWDDEANEWYMMEGDDRKVLSGTMLAFADETLTSLETNIDTKEIGLILGYTLDDDDVWRDENGNPVTGVMKAFAGMKLGTIDTEINTVPVGDILGYNKVGEVWYTDPDNTVPATGVMKFLADRKLNNIEEGINEEPLGTFLGYEHDGTAWNDKNGDPVTGIMKVLAEKNFDNVGTSLESEPIGIFLGYENDEGVWKDENGDPVTGVMKVLADKNFANVGDSLNSEPIGVFLGYENDEGVWKNNGNEVTGIMKVLAGENFSTIGGVTERITIGDLIPEDQRGENDGFISLLDPTVKLDNIAPHINDVLADTSIWDLVECGAIELTDTEKANLALNPIKDYNLSQLLSFVLNPSIP